MDCLWRQSLKVVVAGLLAELGFQYSDKFAHEILTEIMRSLIRQIGLSSHSFCELSGRTEPVLNDVILALVNMGLSAEEIDIYARRPGRIVIAAPVKSAQPKRQGLLSAGKKQPLPRHIPPHFPPLPDPHAYIHTSTHKQPITDYETLRKKSSCHKRNIERALTRFVARTREAQSLFHRQDNMFPLITCQIDVPPYLKALLSPAQCLKSEKGVWLLCSNHGYLASYRKCYCELEENEDSKSVEGKEAETEVIDNPYLRPARIMSRKRVRK